jgi:hypothetical protein
MQFSHVLGVLFFDVLWRNVLATSPPPGIVPAPCIDRRRDSIPPGEMDFESESETEAVSDYESEFGSDLDDSDNDSSSSDGELEGVQGFRVPRRISGPIFCWGIPPARDERLPGYYPARYGDSNQNLCAFNGVPGENLGLRCSLDTPTPHLYYPAPYIEPIDLFRAFKDHCLGHCHCLPRRRAAGRRPHSDDEDEDKGKDELSKDQKPFVNGQRVNLANGGIVLETQYTVDGIVHVSSSTFVPPRSVHLPTPAPEPALWKLLTRVTREQAKQCGGYCSSFSECGDTGCRCIAKKQRFPAIEEVGDYFFRGVCAILSHSRHKLNGRGLDAGENDLCPCNKTYIS